MSEGEKPIISGAICAPPTESSTASSNENVVGQPRQPSNMKGLLKFAMEATKTEDAPQQSQLQPLDEERKRFLEQALTALTIDVIEELMKHIRVLEKVSTLQSDEDPTDYITALENISDYVCNIDTANDFHKIGGFVIIPPCLKACNPKIKAETGHLLAELCQNNPYCQKVALENGLIPILIDIVENDENSEAVTKAVYAISAIVRQNAQGCAQLIQYRGVQIFREKLKLDDERINTKICFLLTALCSFLNDFKSRLIFNGYFPILFALLDEPKQSHEHVLGLILKLLEDNSSGIMGCKQNKFDAQDALNVYLSQVAEKEEFKTLEDLAQTIHKLIFP